MNSAAVNSSPEGPERVRTVSTSADVARRAKVSRATVSYVLNASPGVKISDKTREAVLRAADELDYRPNLAAQSLAAGASKIALFVVPGVHLGESAILTISRLTAHAAELGITLIVHFEGPANRAVTEVARDLRPSVVLSMLDLGDETATWLTDRKIKVASMYPREGLATIASHRAGWMQVTHLADLGHTRIAFADTSEPGLEVVARMRYNEVAVACEERGIPQPDRKEFAFDGRAAEQLVRGWADAGVTAVAAYNDEVAITVLAGIRRAGLRCPHDIAVIGVDEMAINSSMTPPLSSVEIDRDVMARIYADTLSYFLDGETGWAPESSGELLMRVVERESTVGAPSARHQ